MHILCIYSVQIGQGFAPSFVHYSSKSKQATQKEHKQSKGEEGQANKKISCGCRGESHGRIFLVGRIFLCSYNKHSSSAFSAVVSLLLFCCCCLIFVCVYLAFDLRLSLHEDHDEDQDEDQDEDTDDKTKIKATISTKIKAKTQHTHLIIIAEATLVILDPRLALASRSSSLRRCGRDSGQRAKHVVMREWLKCEDPKLTQKGAR